MSEIKSTRASELISYGALSQEYARKKCGYSLITTASARDAVIIAEQEAEERHEQQLQELNDRAVDAFKDTMLEHQVDEYVDCYILIKEFIKKLTKK